MLLLMKGCTTNCFLEGYAHAFVEMTRGDALDLLLLIDQVRGLHNANPSVSHLSLWDTGPTWFDFPDEEGDFELSEALDHADGLFLLLESWPFKRELRDIESRTECDRLEIAIDGVRWTARPKHGDEIIETMDIPRSLIADIAWEKAVPTWPPKGVPNAPA